MAIPELEPWCGSWVVKDRRSGRAMFETFDRTIAEDANPEEYEVVTTYRYLVSLNKKNQSTPEGVPS